MKEGLEASPTSTRSGSTNSPSAQQPLPPGKVLGARGPSLRWDEQLDNFSQVSDRMSYLPSYDAAIRPPPGLEHITSELERPWEHFAFAPVPQPQFEAPTLVELKTPPAPHQEPSVQEPCVLTLLKHLPLQSANSHHDSSSCRPCAFFHTKGCALQSAAPSQKTEVKVGRNAAFVIFALQGRRRGVKSCDARQVQIRTLGHVPLVQ